MVLTSLGLGTPQGHVGTMSGLVRLDAPVLLDVPIEFGGLVPTLSAHHIVLPFAVLSFSQVLQTPPHWFEVGFSRFKGRLSTCIPLDL